MANSVDCAGVGVGGGGGGGGGGGVVGGGRWGGVGGGGVCTICTCQTSTVLNVHISN